MDMFGYIWGVGARVDWIQDAKTTVLVILKDSLLLDFHSSPIIS
jgi:hypothetical protein